MHPDRWGRIEELFAQALPLTPPERRRMVAEIAAADAHLAREVASLLQAYEQPGDPIEHAIQEAAAAQVAPPALEAGKRLGPYQIVREIGRGGMGAVYLAVRADDSFRKQVAIKVIGREGMHPEIVARFRMERQLLATLDHPNIARLLDGGEEDGGISYVVMEYVEGDPIDRHCERFELELPARLALFLQVCAAVSHAHRSLVVHRDLKPGNILVTPDGTPKLLDFGIAKLLDPALAPEGVAMTRAAVRLLTPEYASPEQVRGDPITTAADVYSLGILLYELLTGRRPYRVRTTQPSELEKAICEQEPDRPSTVAVEGKPRGGRRRALAGDLDTIVLMALRKEPERRYASVDHLAEDIRRHLAGLPVSARRDAWGYRASRFARRHRAAVAAGALAAIALCGFSGAMWVQARRLAAERDRANAERDRANTEARTAQRTAAFMVDLFKVADPQEYQGRELTVREILDRGAASVEKDLQEGPLVQGRLMQTLGSVYKSLGEYAQARPLLEKAVALQRQELGPDHVDVGQALVALGNLQSDLADHAAARSSYEGALRILRGAYGEEHDAVARVYNNLGILLRAQGDHEGALAMYEKSLAIKDKILPPDHRSLGSSLQNAANVHLLLGHVDRAEALYARALVISEKNNGAESPQVADIVFNQGVLRASRGAIGDAMALYRRAMEVYVKSGGPDHPDVGSCLENMANLHVRIGQYAEALPMYANAERMLAASLGAAHPQVAEVRLALGTLLVRMGRRVDAERAFTSSADLIARSEDPEHPHLAWALAGLSELAASRGDQARARRDADRAAAIAVKGYGETNAALAPLWLSLARGRRALGDLAGARELTGRALALDGVGAGLPPDMLLPAVQEAALLAALEGDAAEADRLHARADAVREAKAGSFDPILSARADAAYWTARGDRGQALAALEQAASLGLIEPDLARAPDLAVLRGDPAFVELSSRIDARAASAP